MQFGFKLELANPVQANPRIKVSMYSGTRLESKLLAFFVFSVCTHVYLLNYRSELAQIWRQDTDTIHDHNHTNKKNFNASIMGRNGRVVLGA